MRKPSTLSNLTQLTDAQADELFEALRTVPYHAAVGIVRGRFGVETSVSALSRWFTRQGSRRARADIRAAVRASKDFENGLGGAGIEGTERNALTAAYWAAVTRRDLPAIETLGRLILDYNKDRRDTDKTARLLASEKKAASLAGELARARAELGKARAELDKARAKPSSAPPEAVQHALDQALGVPQAQTHE